MSKKAVIFSAPSGSGKTTIVKRQLEIFPLLTFSISATTRVPRDNETNGVDYQFLPVAEFERCISQNDFVEYEEVYPSAYYGTLKKEVERIWSENKVVVFDVDVIGGINLKEYFGDNACSIFIKPPSLAILKERLISRGSESEETLKKRLDKAEYELTFESEFDYSVQNDNLDKAVSEVEQLLTSFISR